MNGLLYVLTFGSPLIGLGLLAVAGYFCTNRASRPRLFGRLAFYTLVMGMLVEAFGVFVFWSTQAGPWQ